jgi:hypothetical protein
MRSSAEEPAAKDISNPWLKFAGMIRDDPDFAEVIEIMEENRRKEDSPAS